MYDKSQYTGRVDDEVMMPWLGFLGKRKKEGADGESWHQGINRRCCVAS
jgi:hypothetical protein